MSGREDNLQSQKSGGIKYSTSEGTGQNPGVYMDNSGIVFAHKCEGKETFLLLYKKGEKIPAYEIPFPSPSVCGGTSAVKVRFPAGGEYEYNFQTDGRIITDSRARQISGREVFGMAASEEPHSVRGVVLRKKYDWRGDVLPNLPYENAVMYQLHVRGYTMQKNSGVRHKGTFRGLMEKLPYIKSLGVNQLRLMPAYEFDELIKPLSEKLPAWAKPPVPTEENTPRRINFWGYTGGYYFAPKSSYASEPARAACEFMDLIRACHKEQIEVIMEFFFGDEMDFKTIADCLEFWAEEYHIDGFAVIARDSVTAELGRLPLFAERKLICSWFGQDTLDHRASKTRRMLAESNDGFRDDCRRFLKGEGGCLENFSVRIRRNPANHATVNYITHHDGFTLMDLVSYDCKHNEANGEMGRDGSDFNLSWNCGAEGPTRKREILQLRLRQIKNAFAMMLLSQGTPMLLAGDESGNSQDGNNNPYCHDSELAWIDWSLKRRESIQALTSFVKDLISFRQKHPILHMACELSCMDLHSSGYPDLSFHSSNAWFGAFESANCHLGCMYDGRYADEDCFLYIAYNMHWTPQEFALPQLPPQMAWQRVIDTSEKDSFIQGGERTSYEKEKSFEVHPRTVVVLEAYKRKDHVPEKGSVPSDLGKDKGTL